MLHMRPHALGRDAMNIDQVLVEASDEIPSHVEHVSKTAGEAGAEIYARGAQNADHSPRHVFATMIAGAFDDAERAGVATRKSFPRPARRIESAAGGAIQAGVAHDDGVARDEIRMSVGPQDDLAAGHSFADIIVGLALEIEVQAADIPDSETLAGGTSQVHDQGRGVHAGVAPAAGDLAGGSRADGAIEIIDG